MTRTRALAAAAAAAMVITIALSLAPITRAQAPAAKPRGGVPQFVWDPTWPKQPFPNNWIIGMGIGVAIDKNEHIWFVHRPKSVTAYEGAAGVNPPRGACCVAAPPVLEFDTAGNLLSSWGGPGQGYEWPQDEHGLTIDHKGNFWLAGAGGPDSQILKFAPGGKFLLQIGHSGKSKGSNDTENLNKPAEVAVDAATNEVWVADGYGNRRVAVYDADTGAYKKHFGAYGNRPDDSAPRVGLYKPGTPPPPQFGLVHCVMFSNDGLVYVCDRTNDRIQVFKKDGTYVREKVITPDLVGATANDMSFSADKAQTYMYVTDHSASKVWIVRRADLETIGSFGYGGHFGGGFTITHDIATDSKGNLYVTEGLEGKRVQRFLYKGLK